LRPSDLFTLGQCGGGSGFEDIELAEADITDSVIQYSRLTIALN